MVASKKLIILSSGPLIRGHYRTTQYRRDRRKVTYNVLTKKHMV